MAEELALLLNELKAIRTYLIKIGPSRRQGNILIVKKGEANQVLLKFNAYLELPKKSSETSLISKISSEFSHLYSDIISLCSQSIVEEEVFADPITMSEETFDLKLALSLLPVMTDNEDNTKQLIESIEYYSSVLSKQGCKNKLIAFVLKSRLSQQAKLKLLSNYDNVDELIKDMRKLLLPRKSHTALQTKLQQCRQNNKTISDFGKEISELFVDLTISQADGNQKSYDVLRPLNEKQAIKRFADGLRDRRLSTIISARNYNSLTDAIQGAQDEEVQSTTSEIIGTYKPNNRFYRGNRTQRGHFRGRSFNNSTRGRGQQTSRGAPGQRSQGPYYSRYNHRGHGFQNRGKSGNNRGNYYSRNNNMHCMSLASEHETTSVPGRSPVTERAPESNTDSLNHFFRV